MLFYPLISCDLKLNIKNKENMKYLIRLTILSIVVLVNGCASIVTGSSQTITFSSEPSEATVIVSGNIVGKTPVSVKIKKGKHQFLTFEKEGYKTFTTQMSTSMNPWFWGNVIFGGLLGSTTDNATGAINQFAPDRYFATLVPEVPFGISTSKPRQIKEIILAFGSEVRGELLLGGGESVNALIDVLGINASEAVMALKVLKKLALKHDDDLEFAIAIIEIYSAK